MLAASSGDYLERYTDWELAELLPSARAIAIDGAKSVGKTETARRRADRELFLDRPETLQLVQADPEGAIIAASQPGSTVLVDEWQRHPPVWDVIRRQVDRQADTTYLITGSAYPPAGVDTHSGAGRVISLRLRPLALSEREPTTPTVWLRDLIAGGTDIHGETAWTLPDYAEAICATGLPGVHQLLPRARRAQIHSYITRAIDRDIPEQGHLVRKPASLRAWWAAYAAASSTTTNYTKILDAATAGMTDKIAKSTALTFRDALTQLWLLDPLEAWLPTMSPLTRLTVAPKHQLLDPGIAAALIGVTEDHLLSGAPGSMELFGRLFESLATLTVRGAAQAAEASVYHLRTRGGEREVDLIIERYDGSVLAIEVKLSTVVEDKDVRHLHWLGEQLGERLRDKIILTSGRHAYRRTDGVAVIPLSLLG